MTMAQILTGSSRFKILYFFSIYERFFREISALLKETKPLFEFSGIISGRIGLAHLQEKPFPWKDLFIYSDFLKQHKIGAPADLAFLKQKEPDLGFPNLTSYIACDRLVSKLPYQKALRILELCIRFVEESLDQAQPDLIIMDDVCCMLSYLIYKIGKKRNIPVWSIGTLKLDDRISIYDDCLDQRKKIESAYQDSPSPLPDPQRKIAAEWLQNYTDHYKPLSYLQYKAKAPALNLDALSKFISFTCERLKDPLDFTYFPWSEIASRKIKRVWRHTWGRLLKLFEEPSAQDQYVYFPLQAQPERTTLVLAPYYLDQITLIENIAKSLPIGYKLYVKEHPIAVGRRPLSDYQRIRKIFNVRLIRTEFPNNELIKNSSCVVTISNTVGLEAIFFEKPLVVLGEVFYNFYRGILYADNVKDLPGKIREGIFSWKSDREDLYRMITALWEGSYPGTRRHPGVIPQVMTPDNLQKVAHAIMREIENCQSSLKSAN
ncbi:MAG: hypothetical protein EXS63_09710 [Candidatus Omnitrophica bacterium]|nr:hypothetical protein [Candidatus Omnitrophota bacterium]